MIGRSRRRDRSETQLDAAIAERIADRSDHAEELAVAGDLDALRQAIARISESHATVLELRYLRELTVRETADVLGLRDDAVRALTYRALRALRQELGEHIADEAGQ